VTEKRTLKFRLHAIHNFQSPCILLKPSMGAGFIAGPTKRAFVVTAKTRFCGWNYESACTWDIFFLVGGSEMLNRHRKQPRMPKQEYLDDVHVRILRVTEDLRAIQRELNCAAMQAPSDPELMELLTQLPELESLDVLKTALDQMRHFLWFYVQVMTSGETEEKPPTAAKKPTAPLVEKYNHATDAALLRYFAEAKNRKPN
jgi:hypothetical protein